VETAIPGVQGLSFVDDISWWAEGANATEVAAKLSGAVTASMGWAAENGVAFDHGKMEVALFQKNKRKKKVAKVAVAVGANSDPFNKAVTR